MEPTTLTAAAIATLVLTKASEKLGEKIGEKLPELSGKVLEQAGKLRQLLKRKSPETATAIEQVAEKPELVEQEPVNYGTAVLVEKVEQAAQADPEVAVAVQELADAVKAQPSVVQNYAKLAEKIGLVVQGGSVNIQNLTF